MSKSHFLFASVFLFLVETSYAKGIVDCRVVSTDTTTECNPYGAKLIKAKEVNYDVDRKKLIISKTLPIPEKKILKVISIDEMIEKYAPIENPTRFYHTPTPFNDTKKDEEELITEIIEPTEIIDVPFINDEVSTSYMVVDKIKEKEIEVTKTKKLSIDYGIYRVISGDILGKIANKFDMTIKELLTLNNLEKNATLKIGQKFKIPHSQRIVDSISKAEYIIESGDTLLSIAHKFKIEPKVLAKFNHLKSSSLIREGKVLLLPLPHIIKKLEIDKNIVQLKQKKELEKKKKLALSKKKKDKVKKKKTSRIKAHIAKRKLYVKNRGIGKHKLRVTATAYSSHRGQTDSTPFLAAWNNRLRPGMKIIAVSRDLLKRYGLRNGTKVRISGLRGYYRVRDKMNKRFKRRIDIYMGINRRRALRWGRRSVVIYW